MLFEIETFNNIVKSERDLFIKTYIYIDIDIDKHIYILYNLNLKSIGC